MTSITAEPISDNHLVLKNGFIVDGTGQPGFTGDIIIVGDKIKEVSKVPIESAGEIIDCTGWVVAPGFIDIHSHMDWILPLDGYDRLKSPFIAQGITTLVTGNCGYSPGGFRKESPFLKMIKLGSDRGFEIDWETMAEYFSYVEKIGLSHNMVHMAGHGTTQISMRGLDPKPLSADEMKEMLLLFEESMEQGAAGVSFGLGYEPGMFFSSDQIKEVARLVQKKNKILTVHGRAYSFLSGFYRERDGTPHNVLSLMEMIDVARETGVRLQYSHLMFAGTRTHSTYTQCLEVIDQAIADGIDIMTDTYPYHCGNSVINVMLPPWFLADLPANYQSEEALTRVEKGLDAMPRHAGFGYEDIQLTFANHPDFNKYNGMFISEIADKSSIPPARVITALSEKTAGRARILNHNYSNMEIIDALISHPNCYFMTDSVVSREGVQNPASFGAFPLLLQYARDRNLISTEEVVRKMTGASAERLNLKDRGFLRPGLAADITVFDSERVKDNNTITETDCEPSGIELVLINGQQVKKNGRIDESAQAGIVVRN